VYISILNWLNEYGVVGEHLNKMKLIYVISHPEYPKNWKNLPMICNNIIRACPFCQNRNMITNRVGNIEHLHLYCSNTCIQRTRLYCNYKIEEALHNLYSFAAQQEYGCSFEESSRHTLLQEQLISAARETESQERPVVQNSNLFYEKRDRNQAIKSSSEVQRSVLLHRLPIEKLEEFNNFPLIAQIGLIHAIPEDAFDVAAATITEMSFLGLFPKNVFHILWSYQRSNSGSEKLVDDIINAFVYRPITMQKVIHILIGPFKKQLELESSSTDAEELNDNEEDMESRTSTLPNTNPVITRHASSNPGPNSEHSSIVKKRQCHATKCRILTAKGILRRPIPSAKGRNMCSGCIAEASKQRENKKLEIEMIKSSASNDILSPLLQYRLKQTDIKTFRRMLTHLPSFANLSRDDLIFGAAKYLANTLGILLQNNAAFHMLDEALTPSQYRQLWRKATFLCRCLTPNTVRYGVRSFCLICSYLAPYPENISHITSCPACNVGTAWELLGSPCLACQFASIVFQNPFASRYESLIHTWLPILSDDNGSDTSNSDVPGYSTRCATHSQTSSTMEKIDLIRQRTAILNASLDSI